MKLWSSLLGGPSASDQERYRDVTEEEFLNGIFGGFVSATGLRITTGDALTVPGISACIQVLSEDLAKVPLILYRKMSNGTRIKAESHPLYARLKESPAPWLSSFAWRRALVANALSYGKGHSRVWRNERGSVERITLLKHGQTTTRWADDTEPFFDIQGKNGYERDLSWQDVIHAPYRGSTANGMWGGVDGISPIDQHPETIALALAAERFAARFFANGARPSIALEMDKKLPNDAVAKRIRTGIERAYSGLDNSFKVAILELGMKLKEFSTNPQDSQLNETRKEQAVQCCTMYGVPPHKIGILDRATNNNIEHQGIDYVTGPVSSLAEAIQSALEIACLSVDEREEYYIEFNLDGLMRGDIHSRYRAYAIGRQWGWLNADDIRGRENMDDLPDGQGKTYLTPMNMTPADKNTADDIDEPEDPSRKSMIVRPTPKDISRFGAIN
ncbi:phage portal protein [Aminobacter carboxidus]|uniref:Phage portal protein n=1 Tax=Aminobacter carboxidus TaxID=376165 RepID=A0ABR9GX79_9HYPH|nr:phage portal protein [Aminobacter carboxidus]MBE1208118.1 phage portal protein [Aminobacter carboxidus]